MVAQTVHAEKFQFLVLHDALPSSPDLATSPQYINARYDSAARWRFAYEPLRLAGVRCRILLACLNSQRSRSTPLKFSSQIRPRNLGAQHLSMTIIVLANVN